MQWFIKALKNYATFSGRARRKEYWFFILFYVLIVIALSIIDGIVGTTMESGGGILSSLFVLAMLIPSISVGVRRLHDTDKSGWFILLGLIPLVGPIILLVFFVMDGTAGDNRFGPNPKAGEA